MSLVDQKREGPMGFQFETVPLIINESGAATRLAEVISSRFKCKRVALITDAGVVAAGDLSSQCKQPCAALGSIR